MVVDSRILIGVVGFSHGGVSVRSADPGHEISHSVVLMALVVVDVPVEDDKARPRLLLLFFQVCGQADFIFTRGVPDAESSLIGRTGIRRVVKYEEDEINIWSKIVELAMQPFALRTTEFIERAVENEHQRVSDAHGVEAALLNRRETRKVVSQ